MRQIHTSVVFFSILLTLFAGGLFAQESAEENTDAETEARDSEVQAAAELAYFDDVRLIEVRNRIGKQIAVTMGMKLPAGYTVQTGASAAELQLVPNGSIIKLSDNTVFTVRKVASAEEEAKGSVAHKFNLVRGKIRSIAAKSGIGVEYEVSTPSAVCGIRGTDFGLVSIPGDQEKAFVNQGMVDYRRLDTNESLTLTSGMMADALSETFRAVQISREQLNEMLKEMQFEKLDPSSVPGHTPVEPQASEEEVEESPEEETETTGSETPEAETPETKAAEQEPVREESELTGLSPGLALAMRKAAPSAAGRSAGDGPLSDFLGSYLGFEIGTITINGDTYSKAVIKPQLSTEKLKLALYLPIIYQNDLFDYSRWYKPEGNDEWSFGSDKNWNSEPDEAIADLARDIALKIDHIEWGEQRDPFYFRIGNLDGMSLGHGSVMKNYANSTDFPAIRRTGLNLGFRGPGGGMEMVADDLAEPDIFGGRIFLTPFWKFSLGFSAVADIDPLETADPEFVESEELKTMSFFIGGADVELPIVESELLSIVPYSDIAALVPEHNGDYYHDLLYDDSADNFVDWMQNYGFSAGFLGNIAVLDYVLEYRYTDGIYTHTFFGPGYDRVRGMRAKEVHNYIEASEAEEGSPEADTPYDDSSMGIYGEAGATVLNAVAFSAGYMWPWHKVDTDHPEDFGDEFSMSVRLLPDVIPVVGIYGGVSYRRRNFVPMLTSNDMTFFDAYSVFGGEAVFPIGSTVEIAAEFSTVVKRDGDGNVVYKDGDPEMIPSITIETRLSF